ncbi:hypothetical protein QYE76_060975 [Lolium multiflorum]|uniref:Uncharacterized protein n=1 Tax=Lolium multiflorum TaxID=4521 RepID=A0AAD8S2C3_LOLMU|nr:hypothetical protein QYE76_060975 [Lolium multiflorum]
MAPSRSTATSAKRRARSRAPPNPSSAPPNPSSGPPAAAGESDLPRHLLHELRYGSLRLINRLVEEAQNGQGVGALHYAARNGIMPVCRYLVEELGVDVDAFDDEGTTPLAYAVIGESVDTVTYLLDHGVDPDKANGEGFTALHHAAGTGNCKMVELLLAEGVSIDPVSVVGTPLHVTAYDGHDEAMKILLENNADHNKIVPGIETPLLAAINASSVKCVKLLVEAGADVNDGLVTPLASAVNNGLTACLKCLLEAGADPNIPGPSGRMPIEIAALNGTREDVEILFPVTSCIRTIHDWSIDGIISHAKSVFMEQGEHSNLREIAELRSLAANSIGRNDYGTAAAMYSLAMKHDPHDATLFSDRSLCWYSMGDAHKALLDAFACREMRPTWPEACCRQGAAFMLLKDYGSACDAFLDATKLDPLSPEIEDALQEALNSLKIAHGRTKSV